MEPALWAPHGQRDTGGQGWSGGAASKAPTSAPQSSFPMPGCDQEHRGHQCGRPNQLQRGLGLEITQKPSLTALEVAIPAPCRPHTALHAADFHQGGFS